MNRTHTDPQTEEKTAFAQKWEGRWDMLAGKAKALWGDITDDDITKAEGNYQKLVGKIKEKTGETREEVERRLNDDNDAR